MRILQKVYNKTGRKQKSKFPMSRTKHNPVGDAMPEMTDEEAIDNNESEKGKFSEKDLLRA